VGIIAHACGVRTPRELRRFHAQVVQPNGLTAPLSELYPEVLQLGHILTQAVGLDPAIEPEVHKLDTKPGDIYLMCSDGLSDLVDDEEMHHTLKAHGESLETAAKRLVQIANEKGGKDNISVILARALRPFTARKSWYTKVFDWF